LREKSRLDLEDWKELGRQSSKRAHQTVGRLSSPHS